MSTCAQEILDAYWDGLLPVNIEHIFQKMGFVFRSEVKEYENSCLMFIDKETKKLNVQINYTTDTAKIWMSAFCLNKEHIDKIKKNPELQLMFSSEMFKYSNLAYRACNNFVLNLLVPQRTLDHAIHHAEVPDLSYLANKFGISDAAMSLRLKLKK